MILQNWDRPDGSFSCCVCVRVNDDLDMIPKIKLKQKQKLFETMNDYGSRCQLILSTIFVEINFFYRPEYCRLRSSIHGSIVIAIIRFEFDKACIESNLAASTAGPTHFWSDTLHRCMCVCVCAIPIMPLNAVSPSSSFLLTV